MKPTLFAIFGISALSASTALAAPFTTLWQLGADDDSSTPFVTESYNSNPAPGSANLLDDDYYLAGTYPAPVGNVAANENPTFFERALTSSDPRNRIHFPLTAAQVTASSQLRITVDLFGGGAWTGTSVPGFNTHNVTVRFNGVTLGSFPGTTWDRTLVFTVAASSVSAVAGENILQLERTGGSAGGYIAMDFIKLEADTTALADADADGMKRGFEEIYNLNDANPADAALDPDGDGLTNLAEFQNGTNPTDFDSDTDGLSDAQEVAQGSNPLKNDTDGDGLLDAQETAAARLLADTDGDTYPDNIEKEQGSDPASAVSVPFAFPGAISLQFISERQGSAKLPAGEPAGFFRQPYWNSSDPLPSWTGDGEVLTGTKTALKNHRGIATTAAATWSYHYAGSGNHKGPSNERLLNGMLETQRNGAVNVPVIVNLTGIPYPSYDLIAYIGRSYPEGSGVVRLGSDVATNRYFSVKTAPPFTGWVEITATTAVGKKEGNYVRYRNLTGTAQTLTLESDPGDNVTFHGVQIIRSGTDTDADGMPDLAEIENGLNPAVTDATADVDADGMTNSAELIAKTNPRLADTDADGVLDGAEITAGTSPLNPDSDGDTLSDGDELTAFPFASSPTLADTDGDGFSDAAERKYHSDPKSATSTPPPVPVWDAATRTWRWRIDNIRVLWNHSESMLGTNWNGETTLFQAVADIERSGWAAQITMGVRFVRGRLTHQFACNNGAFSRLGTPTDGFYTSDWNDPPADRTRALGFSGSGPADESAPLRMEFTATQPNSANNVWTLNFTLADLTNPAAPVSIASYTQTAAAVAQKPSLLAGNAIWQNDDGEVGRIDFRTATGVSTYISPNPLGPLDSDHDGMPNTWETTYSFNTTNAADALLDADSDGLTNLKEFLIGTHPRTADTDGDGASDSTELAQGTDPRAATSLPAWFNFTGTIDDLNSDGLSDSWVLWSGGKSRIAGQDDDGDGMSNRAESLAGTNPDDANSKLDLKAWRSADSFVLSWSNLPDKAHRVETSDTLAAWQVATGLPAASVAAGRRQVSIPAVFPAASAKKFYRTSVQPVDADSDGVEDWVEKNVLASSPTSAASLGLPLNRFNGQPLSGDAAALLDRLQGTTPTGGIPGSSVAGTPSLVNASRFLMQATFGPTSPAIHEVRTLGYAAWIDRQLTLPPSFLSPYIREIKADAAGPQLDPTYNFNGMDRFVTGNNVTTPFARNATTAEDQLRQRVAFALSQILVTSRRDATLEEKPEAMTHYYDMLIRHAFGNYGDLLREVTFHPTMGTYLSHVGNQKADPSIQRFPDENYAREIMQLFTIGLWELNPDGSRKLDAAGQPIPTYDNGTITQLARVFTGLYYASPYGWGNGGYTEDQFTRPMVMHADRHDFERKQLPNGVVIPAREPTEANGNQDVRDAVEALFRHPNTPPYICRQLIQFLVTDNPSPGYIQRVQGIFVNDGTGLRGNLGAVVKAILLDPEARNASISPSFGKVREPVIRTMHLGRLFHVGKRHPKFVWWNYPDTYLSSSAQEPMNSPSVFNFYTPVYQSPGEIRNAGLVSPGFQIINTYSAVAFPNLLWEYVHDGFRAAYNYEYPLDYGDLLLLAENPPALIAQADLLLCSGNMTARTRSLLLTALAAPGLTPQDRVSLTVYTAITSPEGVVQK